MISPATASPTSPLLTWLRLLRLPTVFTALADVLCGFLVGAVAAATGEPDWIVLPWLLLSSAALYLSGMVLNDVLDARLDAVERPERPIPSGRVSLRSAAIAGFLLMITGLVAGGAAWITANRSGHSLMIAVLIAIAVLTYNAVLKATWAGPFSMAICRFLNLSLGASTAINSTGTVMAWQQPVLGAASGLTVYIVGVTWFARSEAGNASRLGLTVGLIVATAGVVVSAGSTLLTQQDRTIAMVALLQFAVIVGITIARGVTAIRNGQSPVLQRTVGKMLLWIIILDAGVVFAATGSGITEGVVLLLLVPALLLRKRIPMS